MPQPIPDLWGDTPDAQETPALRLLRAQADLLGQRTGGTVTASVSTISLRDTLAHQFDVSTPAAPDYRYCLLTVYEEDPVREQFRLDLGWDVMKATGMRQFEKQLARVLQDEGTRRLIAELKALAEPAS